MERLELLQRLDPAIGVRDVDVIKDNAIRVVVDSACWKRVSIERTRDGPADQMLDAWRAVWTLHHVSADTSQIVKLNADIVGDGNRPLQFLGTVYRQGQTESTRIVVALPK